MLQTTFLKFKFLLCCFLNLEKIEWSQAQSYSNKFNVDIMLDLNLGLQLIHSIIFKVTLLNKIRLTTKKSRRLPAHADPNGLKCCVGCSPTTGCKYSVSSPVMVLKVQSG